MTRTWLYQIQGRELIPVDVMDWRVQPIEERRVAEDHVGDVYVSTVFLGVDHSFEGPPLLFETMVFGGVFDRAQERYTTWEEAETGHARILAMVQAAQERRPDGV